MVVNRGAVLLVMFFLEEDVRQTAFGKAHGIAQPLLSGYTRGAYKPGRTHAEAIDNATRGTPVHVPVASWDEPVSERESERHEKRRARLRRRTLERAWASRRRPEGRA